MNQAITEIRAGIQGQLAEIELIKTRMNQFHEKEKQFEIKLKSTEGEMQAAEEELRRLQSQRMQASSEKMLSGLKVQRLKHSLLKFPC